MAKPPLPFVASNVVRGKYLAIPSGAPRANPLAVAYAGWEECSKRYVVDRTGFQFVALEYIASGEWEIETAHGCWQAGPGTVFTYGPAIAHRLSPVSEHGLVKYFVDFASKMATAALLDVGLRPGIPAALSDRKCVHALLDQLIDTGTIGAGAKIQALIPELLIEIMRVSVRPFERQTQGQITFESCRGYIASQYLSLPGVGEAAEKCGVSRAHLCRLFNIFGTETPLEFLTRLKIDHAAQRMIRDGLSVKAAAAEVGFKDPYHFSRVFKKVVGVAPSHSRKAIKFLHEPQA